MEICSHPHETISYIQVWEGHGSNQSLAKWIACMRKEPVLRDVKHTLDSGKAVLFRNTGFCSAKDFEQSLAALNATFISYEGGTSPRQKKGSMIYTATDLPANHSIPLHQEMAYIKDSPRYIAFFCYQPANFGQKTTIIGDMNRVTCDIPKHLIEKYTDRKLRLRRYLPSRTNVTSSLGLKKSWEEVFLTHDLTQLKAIAENKGWNVIDHANGDIGLIQEALEPLRQVGNKFVWCNQAHVFSLSSQKYWADVDGRTDEYNRLCEAQDGPIEYTDHICHDDLTPIDSEESLALFKIMEKHCEYIELEQGDVILLDNYQLGHGRTTYHGDRKIYVSLMSDIGLAGNH